MPDINPADLSRPAVGLATPILSNKSITVSALKPIKTSQAIPQRIELEQAYVALKSVIGNEQWKAYKDATTQFLIGRLNQAEYSNIVDPILASPNGDKEHLHNQLIAAIYGNVTREMPDGGLAPWVSANDKPSSGVGSKASSGDANKQRLKGEVMLLPSKDRRRIKDIVHNEFDPYDSLANIFTEQHRAKGPRAVEMPTSASGGINRRNLDLEIRKRFAQPLAVESGEFPDTSNIESRMLPFCYEAGLVSGHAPEAAHFMSVATETFIKEVLSSVFSRTRSNGPGEFGSAGFGGNHWVQTHKYRRRLAREEERAHRGEILRDKSGLLPIEAKKASERGPLGLAELRIALEMGDCGLAQFPIVGHSLFEAYREGELEGWNDHAWIGGELDPNRSGDVPAILPPSATGAAASAAAAAAAAAAASTLGATTVDMEKSLSTTSVTARPGEAINGMGPGPTSAMAATATATATATAAAAVLAADGASLSTVSAAKDAAWIAKAAAGGGGGGGGGLPNGVGYADLMDVDDDDVWWDGAGAGEVDQLDNVLESCLAVG